jgi:hypothetical protein
MIMMSALGSIAQEKSAKPATGAASMTPAQIRSKLGFLVGSFMTETTMPAGPMVPKGGSGTGMTTMSWALDSMFIFLDDNTTSEILGPYKAHGVLGYEPMSKQFVLSMFNNSGDRPTYRGDFNGDTLVLSTTVPMPKHPFEQKILWYKEGDGVRLQIFLDAGKGYSLILDQKAMRTPPPVR